MSSLSFCPLFLSITMEKIELPRWSRTKVPTTIAAPTYKGSSALKRKIDPTTPLRAHKI
ncbi:hypothetical protein MARSALSMR5_00433 [Marinobacter salarius]|uniref:Uncharacterized protein n=1 Tax=Marinobacter salarius TaxID=1420917 RepID=A0A1W6K529_9GAMM|nr:hypothetical protein MARSALSMR5_00433 [Marinobacter salarius]